MEIWGCCHANNATQLEHAAVVMQNNATQLNHAAVAMQIPHRIKRVADAKQILHSFISHHWFHANNATQLNNVAVAMQISHGLMMQLLPCKCHTTSNHGAVALLLMLHRLMMLHKLNMQLLLT